MDFLKLKVERSYIAWKNIYRCFEQFILWSMNVHRIISKDINLNGMESRLSDTPETTGGFIGIFVIVELF